MFLGVKDFRTITPARRELRRESRNVRHKSIDILNILHYSDKGGWAM
jgi:hypothetical protein